jgi:hypothetical protein
LKRRLALLERLNSPETNKKLTTLPIVALIMLTRFSQPCKCLFDFSPWAVGQAKLTILAAVIRSSLSDHFWHSAVEVHHSAGRNFSAST